MYPYAGDRPGTLMDPSGATWCMVPFTTGDTCISDRRWNKLKPIEQRDKEEAGYHHVSSDITVQISGAMPPPIPLMGVMFQPYSDPYLTLATDVSNFHPDAFIWSFAWRAAVDGVALGASSALLGVSIFGPEAEGEGGPEPDLQNLSPKIQDDMARRAWTKQDILGTVQQAREGGSAYPAVNKATGGPATEYVSPSSGKFVVIDNQTGGVIRVSRAGMLPNYLAK